jgi:hypothetical protein
MFFEHKINIEKPISFSKMIMFYSLKNHLMQKQDFFSKQQNRGTFS